jgi:DNA-directed RNA polymerase specialized sigma24 family protein
MTTMKEIDQLMATAESPDPADGLRAASLLRRLADQMEARHVNAARVAGWSWQEIGDALGVSRQAVHKKHRRNIV